MNILFVINSLKDKSGSERVAIELANKVSSLPNFKVTIINRESTKAETAYPVVDGVNIMALRGGNFSFYNQLKEHLNCNSYDNVIVHNMGKLALLCCFLSNIKKLITLEHVSFVSRPALVRFLSRIFYKNVSQVLTLTNSDKDAFENFHRNVLVIPNFSPFKIEFAEKLLHNEIVTIGRLTDQKNYIHLLKAWEKISSMIPDWKLSIYGDGEHKNTLLKYIDENQLKNVTLKGVTADVIKVYKESDFFIMSSKYEGLPMVLIEAQTFGLPIISYNCPFGPADIVRDQYNGFLVENQNIQMLADKILQLATSPELLQEFSKNSIENAKKYQSEQILDIWTEKILKG